MALISETLAKQHLRVTTAAEDSLIATYTRAAEQAAMEFMNRTVYEDQDSLDEAVSEGLAGDRPMIITDLMRAGILLILGDLYSHRENTVLGVSVAELPKGAISLLQPYRINMGV